MKDLTPICNVSTPLGGPVRDVLGNIIGRPDQVFGRTPDQLPTGTLIRDIRGNIVGEVGPLGGILPPPKIGPMG